MDIADGYRIKTTLAATVQAFRELDVLTSIYRDRKVHIFGAHSLTLTAQQRSGVKDAAQAVAARIGRVLDSAAQPTGKTGAVNADELAQMEQQPAAAFQALMNFDGQVQQYLPPPVVQDDGTVVGTVDEKLAQNIADNVATLAAGLRLFLGVLTARLG